MGLSDHFEQPVASQIPELSRQILPPISSAALFNSAASTPQRISQYFHRPHDYGGLLPPPLESLFRPFSSLAGCKVALFRTCCV